MATLKELNSQLAAAQKKHGAKSQAAGRIQYKINQLNKGSKGTAVKTKTGVLKSKTGVVRQTDATKKKRTVTKRKTPSAKQPNNPFKAIASAAPAAKIKGSPIKKKIAANSGSKAKKITSNSGSKGNIEPVKLNNITLSSTKANRLSKQQKQKQIQAENNKKIAANSGSKVTTKKVGYTPTNKVVVANLSAAAKKQAENKRLQAARNKLSTAEKDKQRKKDYRNNKTSPY